MPNINNYLKTCAFGSLALFLGQQAFAAKSDVATNGVVDHIFKGLSTSPKNECKTFLPDVIYNSQDKALIDHSLKKCEKYINARFSEHHLTSIHLAAIAGNDYGVNQLQKKGVNIDVGDRHGYTALHHVAMLGDKVGVKNLLNLGADPTKRTKLGATYVDLLRWSTPFRNTDGETLDSTLFSTHTHDDYIVDPRCLGDGIKFVHEMVVSSENQVNLWSQVVMEVEGIPSEKEKDLMAEYAYFKQNPPKLVIKPIEKDDSGKALGLGDHFCGLVALESIKSGRIVAEYVGEVISEKDWLSHQDQTYMIIEKPVIDAKFYRSAAAMANHAFPNAYTLGLQFDYKIDDNGQTKVTYGVDGLPSRTLLRADSDIKVGEQITISYGFKYDLLEQSFIELRPEAIKMFFSTYSWKDLGKSFKAKIAALEANDSQAENYHIGILNRLIYLISNPMAIKTIVDLGLLKENDLKVISSMEKETGLLKELGIEETLSLIQEAIKEKVKKDEL